MVRNLYRILNVSRTYRCTLLYDFVIRGAEEIGKDVNGDERTGMKRCKTRMNECVCACDRGAERAYASSTLTLVYVYSQTCDIYNASIDSNFYFT